ncbi:MAG TPA: LPS export ABC transporter periplasmic protein LptC [Bacteroidota bacterium]|nr:LPS export ABC transporter periplasmic protein LptC [Bacteroidota bacterium]
MKAATVVMMWLLLTLTAFSCEEKIKPSVLHNLNSAQLPKQESWNSTISISDSGKAKALIKAGYIRVFEYPAETHLSEGITVHFFDEQGKETSVLTAEAGKVDDVTNNLEARGNVVVVSSDSTVLRTSVLFWNNGSKLIHTAEFVDIVSPKEKIQGKGFEADQGLKNYRIFRVTGEANTE